ncbi:transketolase family protein [Candidatus Atribacteria bacterium MT.SAG.1]|nr:transketolase family protein [Candidatus Atribacteria bacterium MT.SAG.1]
MISMRDAFGNCIVELARIRDDFVVLDADVAGGTGTKLFQTTFPDRFIQCGIAEQNMMSVAAGLSTTGTIPVVTCYAVFASMRAIEQARNSIAYPNFNVKVVASHLGLDVGPDGPTHQAIEDISIYRSIPNFKIVAPADPNEMKTVLPVILNSYGPVYLRTGRSPLPTFLNEDIKFEWGKGNILIEGNDVTIIAVGVMVYRALEAAKQLEKEGISCRVVNMSSLKPIDKELIIDSAKKTGFIITAEDHNIMGGLGGAVAEILSENYPVPMVRVGIMDCFAESGDPKELAEKYGLDSQGIEKAAKKILNK